MHSKLLSLGSLALSTPQGRRHSENYRVLSEHPVAKNVRYTLEG
jgi:hypothetical protein